VLTRARCLETVADAVARMESYATGNLGRSVEHCPGFDVAKLLEHTGGFCRIVAGRVARDEEWVPASGTWQQAPPDEVAGDPIGWHRTWGTELIESLAAAEAADPVTTWAGRRRATSGCAGPRTS
jgi:hypothetical protein